MSACGKANTLRTRLLRAPGIGIPTAVVIANLEFAFADDRVMGILGDERVPAVFTGFSATARPTEDDRVFAVVAEGHDLQAERVVTARLPEPGEILGGVGLAGEVLGCVLLPNVGNRLVPGRDRCGTIVQGCTAALVGCLNSYPEHFPPIELPRVRASRSR